MFALCILTFYNILLLDNCYFVVAMQIALTASSSYSDDIHYYTAHHDAI